MVVEALVDGRLRQSGVCGCRLRYQRILMFVGFADGGQRRRAVCHRHGRCGLGGEGVASTIEAGREANSKPRGSGLIISAWRRCGII